MAEVGGRVKRQSKTDNSATAGRKCRPCLNKNIQRVAEVFCPSCNEFQCNDCSNAHTIYTFMNDHKLLTVAEGLDYVAKTLDLKGLDVCTKHNKPFEFFCDRNKVLVCSTCAVIDHKKCRKVVEIERLAEDGQCDALVKQLQTALTKTNCAIEILAEADQCLYNDIQLIPEKLTEMKKTIIRQFDNFAENVTKMASSYRHKTVNDWTKHKQELEQIMKTMKQSCDTIESIAQSGTPLQQFIAVNSMTTSIQQHVRDADISCTGVQDLNVSCQFDQPFAALQSNLLSTLKPEALKMNYKIPKQTQLVEIKSIDFEPSGGNKEEPLYTGLSFLPDGRLVAVDNHNGKCLLYDENLRLLSTYTLPYRRPQCVAVVSDDEVAITTGGNYRLDILHVSKSNEITLSRTCKVSVEYFSISMNDDAMCIVGTYDNTPPVRIVSLSGVEKDFDIVFPSKKYPIGTSSCTYIRGQDKVVLADRYDNAVCVYNVVSGSKVEIRNALIKQPLGVTVGLYDHVFVGSMNATTTSIVEITPAGRVLKSHQVDMFAPCTLAVSVDGLRLAVSNAYVGSRKLKLYRIHSV